MSINDVKGFVVKEVKKSEKQATVNAQRTQCRGTHKRKDC